MNEKKVKFSIKPYIGVGIGSIVMAFSVILFIGPTKLVPGGIMGIANILYHLFGFKMGLTTLAFSIPIFITGTLVLGGSTGFKTIFCNVIYSVFVDIAYNLIPPLTMNTGLAAVFGGALMGAGVGIILGFGGTFGGTDLLARIVHKHFPSLPVQWIMFGFDFLVILAGGIFFGAELALFSIITIFVSTKVIDIIQEGTDFQKSFIIVSEKPDEVSAFVKNVLKRGVTELEGIGSYSGTKRKVLLCVVRRGEVFQMKNEVMTIDPNAFVTITDVREVFGRGFDGGLFGI